MPSLWEGVNVTDYERGFNEGFAAALQRIERGASNSTGRLDPDLSGGKKISIAFRPDQFSLISDLSLEKDCSFGAAVRHLLDRSINSARE